MDVWLILGNDAGRRTQRDNERMGKAMKRLGWEAKQRRFDGEKASVYVKGTDEERNKLIYVYRDPDTRVPRGYRFGDARVSARKRRRDWDFAL
jgi:hypothetical protein